jgi:hypothetical protein
MNKNLIIKKGYTLEVISCENDGAFFSKNSIVLDNLEEIEAYVNFLKLITDNDLGNSYQDDFDNKQKENIVNFINLNQHLLSKEKLTTNVDCLGLFHDIKYTLLGNSDDYLCRDVVSYIVTYSPEDVYSSIIFKS